MQLLKKIGQIYQIIGTNLLTTLILLFALNAVLAVFYHYRYPAPSESPSIIQRYGVEKMSSIYNNMSEEDMIELLTKTWHRPQQYEPYVQFKETPIESKFVNVSEHKFRHAGLDLPWPLDPETTNIFMFGGSTTFGHGVKDDETITRYLSDALNQKTGNKVNVYNFGSAKYVSTQERILFQQLLLEGHTPDLVIFMDGLNEFYFGATPTPPLTDHIYSKLYSTNTSGIVENSSISKALKAFSNRLRNANAEAVEKKLFTADEIIERYKKNITLTEAVAKAMGITPVFLWQPVPAYNYDLQYHPFAERIKDANYQKFNDGYSLLKYSYQNKELSSNFLWGGDLQENETQTLYVDKIHYTPYFNQQIAAFIAQHILSSNLLTKED